MRVYKFFILTILILSFGCSETPNNNGGSTTTVIPIAPNNLTGSVLSSSQVALSWTDNSTNETGFKIERKIDGAISFNLVGTVNTADIISYTDTGLNANTTYTYRLLSFNAVGNSITYSNECTITTGDVPILSTNAASVITITTATSGGNITDTRGSNISARGVVWSTTHNPTIALSTKTTDGSGAGLFTSNLAALSANTIYYIRAYATNSNGTGYGNEISFTTLNYSLPTLTTTSISSIGYATATSGGNISNDGGSPVTERGVIWSTSINPTIALNTKTINGAGSGLFSSNLSGLLPITRYYVRAYATNVMGTSYGNETSFFTIAEPYSYTQGPNVADIDGNTYASITNNCGQTWTTKNLNVSHYRNGDIIPKVTDQATWNSLTTGAYCYYNNDSATYAATYGKLYNWYALVDPRGLGPNGWRIPTDADWNKFVKCIDYNADTTTNTNQRTFAGGAMKETGISNWTTPNQGATNISGFNARPGGVRNSIFQVVNDYGHYWSSTEIDGGTAWPRILWFGDGDIYRQDRQLKGSGKSVRLIKN